ncbi:MarR family transcriptional regulator (plasmid) [Roseibium aggregatum]|uniref:MarR family winged helix-turn-helix transcriptional regulator n=1 Tax=Stappiaceae TaxID=2821832 RepID=UPI0003B80886|nr:MULTISPECIES: MarR family transcriptional regulator [Stappiaceae]ERP90760.1 MarR family transcriptional regulator [Labrenzia sp. C1B10]ERS08488.1 MarR family transcriptional regulator [Labrenzia sp. C1B70]MBO6856733.1 MarR family transcriptional regulator [Roseibium sp.]MEC9403523.1 MarR family transcriptional regulator [Pseudomonadota bacterium]MBN8184361.1 MarR family transcriptional regulator [Roseibium aggregatum]
MTLTPEKFVSSYLLYLLAASSEAASHQFHLRVRELGLRVPEWRVLACLYDQDGLMITQLAKYSLLEQSRMTRIVDQMEKRGLVVRKSDKGDGRRVRVHLTDAGQKLSSEVVEEAREHERTLLSALNQSDADRIKPSLERLLASLNSWNSANE